jgi:hypothetical protein
VKSNSDCAPTYALGVCKIFLHKNALHTYIHTYVLEHSMV